MDLTIAKRKYLNDAEYHCLVDSLYQYVEKCQFTPTELREAAFLASLHYEMYHTKSFLAYSTPTHESSWVKDKFINKENHETISQNPDNLQTRPRQQF